MKETIRWLPFALTLLSETRSKSLCHHPGWKMNLRSPRPFDCPTVGHTKQGAGIALLTPAPFRWLPSFLREPGVIETRRILDIIGKLLPLQDST